MAFEFKIAANVAPDVLARLDSSIPGTPLSSHFGRFNPRNETIYRGGPAVKMTPHLGQRI